MPADRARLLRLLAFVAGLMNAWTLHHAQTFATVQSGNVVQSGYRLVQGDWSGFTFALASVIAFGLGSALCGVLMTNLVPLLSSLDGHREPKVGAADMTR